MAFVCFMALRTAWRPSLMVVLNVGGASCRRRTPAPQAPPMSVALATVAMRSRVTHMSLDLSGHATSRCSAHDSEATCLCDVDANRPRAVGCGSPGVCSPLQFAQTKVRPGPAASASRQVAGHVTNLVWASGSDSDDDSPEYLVAQRPFPLRDAPCAVNLSKVPGGPKISAARAAPTPTLHRQVANGQLGPDSVARCWIVWLRPRHRFPQFSHLGAQGPAHLRRSNQNLRPGSCLHRESRPQVWR